MLEEYAFFISVIALSISIIDLILHYKYRKITTGVAIIHELSILPPYITAEEKTTIRIKNLGNAVARLDGTYFAFSWDEDLIVYLDYGCEEDEEFYLNPNGVETFYKRLPEPPKDGDYVVSIVTEYDDEWSKKDKFPFRYIKSVASVRKA